MEFTQRTQILPEIELSPPTKRRRIPIRKQIDAYDKKSAELRRYLASEKAMRELEQRRDYSMAVAHRMSFIR